MKHPRLIEFFRHIRHSDGGSTSLLVFCTPGSTSTLALWGDELGGWRGEVVNGLGSEKCNCFASMYGIFSYMSSYIWLICIGKCRYTIYGCYRNVSSTRPKVSVRSSSQSLSKKKTPLPGGLLSFQPSPNGFLGWEVLSQNEKNGSTHIAHHVFQHRFVKINL